MKEFLLYHNLMRRLNRYFKTDILQSQIETINPMYIHEAPTSNKADMRVVTAPAVHTIFSRKEIVIPQTNTSFSYNFTQYPASNHWKEREKSRP